MRRQLANNGQPIGRDWPYAGPRHLRRFTLPKRRELTKVDEAAVTRDASGSFAADGGTAPARNASAEMSREPPHPATYTSPVGRGKTSRAATLILLAKERGRRQTIAVG